MKHSPEKKTHDTFLVRLQTKEDPGKIPTTFVPLAPERIDFRGNADILVGLFHVMWLDMPSRRIYRLKLSDFVSEDGVCVGCRLFCGSVVIKV